MTTVLTTTTPALAVAGSATAQREAVSTRYARQAGRRRLVCDLLSAAASLILVVPLAFWIADGGLATASGVGGVLTALGDIAGLLATSALVLTLWLTARVRPIERALGHDHALALRNASARWALSGLGLHALLLLGGHMVSVGLGLGVAAPFASFTSLPGLSVVARVWWVAMIGAASAAVLTWRLVLPLVTSWRHRLVVSQVVDESTGVVSVLLAGQRVARLHVRAGEFCAWRFLAPGLWSRSHAFAIADSPRGDTLRITVRVTGDGARRVAKALRPGTPVLFAGPYGDFSDAARTAPDVVVVSFGAGAGPVRALLEETDFAPGGATVIVRASSAEELVTGRELEELCLVRGARFVPLVGPEGVRRDGSRSWLPSDRAGLRLADVAGRLDEADVYVCGPDADARLVVAEAEASGVQSDSIHHERFGW